MTDKTMRCWCLAIMFPILVTGFCSVKAETRSRADDTIAFRVYGTSKEGKGDDGVDVSLDKDGGMRMVVTGYFYCETGTFNLEKVRMAAFGQSIGTLARFLGEKVETTGPVKNDNKTVKKESSVASYVFGKAQVDTKRTKKLWKLNSSKRVGKTTHDTTKITCGEKLNILIEVFRNIDSVSGEAVMSKIDMPSDMTPEKFLELCSLDKLSLKVLSERASFRNLDKEELARAGRSSQNVVPIVSRLLATKGGICRYRVVLEIKTVK